jgi:outer membrane biosynthesis protein TonB
MHEHNNQLKAIAWTIGVHLALLLFLWLFKYAIPSAPPIEELGMEVNLGTSDMGSGADQPMSVEDPATDVAMVANRATQQQNNESKNLLQSSDKDAPEVNTAEKNNANRNNTEENNRRRRQTDRQDNSNNHQQPHARYVYNGSTGHGGNSSYQNTPGSHEGNDPNGNGDKGVPNGTPGATNYSGSPGNGNGGISHTISGRTIVAFPPKEAKYKEDGVVVVRVTVNRDGAIVNKQIVSATSAELRNIALHKVDKVRFNKSTTAPEEQFGNITFVFKTRD